MATAYSWHLPSEVMSDHMTFQLKENQLLQGKFLLFPYGRDTDKEKVKDILVT